MKTYVPDPNRFEASKTTLLIDRFMNQFIKIGGIGIIVVVTGIFVFIGWQILPLFQKASVTLMAEHQLDQKDRYVFLGQDEYNELPFLIREDGSVVFYDLVGERGRIESFTEVPPKSPATVNEAGESTEPPAQPASITAVSYNPRIQSILYGTSDGRFGKAKVEYTPTYGPRNERVMTAAIVPDSIWLPFKAENVPVTRVAFGDFGTSKLAAAIQEENGQFHISALLITQETSLFGEGEPQVEAVFDLTPQVEGRPAFLLVNKTADGILVGTTEGTIYYFFRTGNQMELRQKFTPFKDTSDPKLSQMEFLFGDNSIVLTNTQGNNRIFSLYIPKDGNTRLWFQTKQFPNLPGPAETYSPSGRNKAFLITSDKEVSLRFSTTEDIRYQKSVNFPVTLSSLGLKYDSILLLDDQNRLHIYKLRDPHPDGSFKSYFSKIWYEGSNEPKYEWQSTGGSDDFEPKLSMVPLIIGTLKGTLYAMIFAVPIALLAAIYVSQFAHPDVRRVVKPTMEIMASLPSVVLGFLAALWLAPILETRVPSILIICIAVPIAALLMGQAWNLLPPRHRIWMQQGGHEWWFFLPVMLVVAWAGWSLGPILEQKFFVVTDPDTGLRIADFRRWWPIVTGTDFQQRNSLVVGFVMGFAVIPIIFTITEDSLSNVPGALRSGSLALGASRWQTAMRIVLPTASAGIFSALMIGLGRAVGETMIVVMATGNTPIMEWNIFSGMRTLSANIAVELPEAAVGGTLYRALFFGAMVLFLMTFAFNTLAEILRQHLREKYKMV
ncbi:MAG: ABC transporter permease subunit [Candidatus Methylacidiphilales bacterium]